MGCSPSLRSRAGIQINGRALRDHDAVTATDRDDTYGPLIAGRDRDGPQFRLVEIHVTSQAMREVPRPDVQLGPLISSQMLAGLKPVLGGLSDLAAKSLVRLVEPLHGVFSRLAEAVPENWREIPDLDYDAALDMMNDRIPLIWVPRSSIVAQLMQARGAADRGEVLAQARQDVADDCSAVLADITAPHLMPLAVMAAEAVRTLRDGYCAGAQALATDVFDTWLQLMVRRSILFDPPPKRIGFYPNVVGQIEPVSGDLPIVHLRATGALAPVLLALARFFPGDRGPDALRTARYGARSHPGALHGRQRGRGGHTDDVGPPAVAGPRLVTGGTGRRRASPKVRW